MVYDTEKIRDNVNDSSWLVLVSGQVVGRVDKRRSTRCTENPWKVFRRVDEGSGVQRFKLVAMVYSGETSMTENPVPTHLGTRGKAIRLAAGIDA